MTLQQLRFLVAIADAGLNITLAAERVHATQPGLSKQLKQLEEQLGLLLFVRKGKSLERATPAGEIVVARARAILEEVRNIRDLAANLRNESSGRLSIATVHTQARFVLPRVLGELRKRFPEVAVQVDPGSAEEIIKRVRDGHSDLAILSTSGQSPEGVLALPAYRWDRVMAVPQGHALSSLKRAPTLADLARWPLVSYESSLRPDSSLRQAFAVHGLVPQLALTARDADLIKTYVRAGLGVGVLAGMAIEEADHLDLYVHPLTGELPRCTTWVLLRRDSVLRRYAQEFISLFAPHLDAATLRRVLSDPAAAARIDAPLWGEGARVQAESARSRLGN